MPPLDDPRALDQELVLRCLAGDPEAWAAFVRRHTPYLAGAIRQCLQKRGHPPDAETVDDVLQDIYSELLRNDRASLRRFRPELPLSGYLAGIAVHRTLRWMRQRRPEGLSTLRPVAEDPAPSSLDAQETYQRLERALALLPERDRLLLRLFYWNELPAAWIARLAGVRPGTVWPRVSRARRRLGEILRRAAPLLF